MPTKISGKAKGLVVKVNLFSLAKAKDFNAERARLWIKGTVTDADGKNRKMFNDAGELISILGRWNVARLKVLQRTNKV